jgi:hypothetical protein
MDDNDEYPVLDESDFMEVERNYSPIFGLVILVLTVAGFIVLLS